MSPERRRLIQYLARYRRAFVTGFVCVVLATAISTGAPWVLKFAIDDLSQGLTFDKVRLYGLLLFVLAAMGGLFRFFTRRIIIGASRNFEYDLRNDFFAALQRLHLSYFQHHRTGDLMSRATSDLGAVRMMVGPAVMYTTSTVLTFVVAIALMVSIDPWLSLVALVPMPFVTVVVKYFGVAIHSRFEKIQEQLSDISAIAQESLAGVRVVRAYGQEAFEIARFRAANEEYVHRNRALIRLQGFYFPSMGLLMGIGALLVLWLGSRRVVAGQMTIGGLVAFNAYLMMLGWPMIAFGWVSNLLQRGMASWKRLLEVLDVVPLISDRDANKAIQSISGEVEFRNLTFSFGETVVLHSISFKVPKGTTTAIVGATGSGKSTVLSFLPRLHNPPAGSVFIDGIDVRQIPLDVLRGGIGFVNQEPFLFSTTLAENIAFGARGDQGHLDRVAEAASIARLDKDLPQFPQGYDTPVGERGITLSGGQKQRVAIARALVIDPKILVLDDALSAVDTHTEEEILDRLSDVMVQRTSIIVSHRVSTVRGAHQIVVLHDGRVAERGTHDELIRRDGFYADLYRKQLLEEELKAS
jgi:ATP-binding cassette subfamily B protein